ncbi:MAG: hypothetical protein ACLP1X_28625 [Polyangiaceae bacterium]
MSSQGDYTSDVAKVTAGLTAKPCECPEVPTPCCRGGACHADTQCADAAAPTDAGAIDDAVVSVDAPGG